MQRIHCRTVLAVLLAHACATAAQTADEAAVVVTATRFATADPRVPATLSVITREEIRTSPALNLPDLLRTRAGVNVSPLYGNLGTDASVDLRGFGEAAGSNVLVLVDGQRINPIDSGNLVWSTVPLESIERIEIQRGGGTVLYGDRASGGVINIITDKSGQPRAGITATIGSYGQRGLDAYAAGGNETGYANIFAHAAGADGWRRNNQQDQQSVNGRVGHYIDGGELALDYAAYKESAGLPGYLVTAAYQADPRGARNPLDSQRRDGYRLRPGVKLQFADSLALETELTTAKETQHWDSPSFGSISDRDKHTRSLTPRLRWNHGLGNLPSETVFGYDYYDGRVDARSTTAPVQWALQTSSAYYMQNSTALTDAWTLTAGARTQRMDQSVHQDAYAAWATPTIDGDSMRRQNAYDLGASYSAKDWRAYGKVGSTFRFANTDELFGYDLIGNSIFAGDLKPQHGTLREIGGDVRLGQVKLRGALYRMDLKDEIGYDSTVGLFGNNINFDPTRRQGIETEGDWRINERFKARIAYAYTDASFREGPYGGHAMPLVPRHKGSLQLTWNAGSAGDYSAVVNSVGQRPYGGDRTESQGKAPAYATVDLLGSWDMKPWKLTARLLNAFDKRYAAVAGYATYLAPPDRYYYPADGRTLSVSVGYDFR